MKLAIGTAQFGFHYGATNRSGQISRVEGKKILEVARALGINTLDSATDYGQSEQRLGDLGVQDFLLITKLPGKRDLSQTTGDWFSSCVEASLKKLSVPFLNGLLLHCPEQLQAENVEEFLAAVEREKKRGRVSKFGISVYEPLQIARVTELINLDIVQAPLNIFDRRLVESGWMQKLHEKGVEIHVRSAFLQGLLLMKRHELPEKFNRWRPLFEQWYVWLAKENLTPVEGCLAAVDDFRVSRVLIGVENAIQLQQIANATQKTKPRELPRLNCEDRNLINPFNWEK